MTEKSSMTFDVVLFLHLNRLSLNSVNIMDKSASYPEDKLLSFRLGILHFETLLAPFLSEDYKIKKRPIVLELEQVGVGQNSAYFLLCQRLLKLLIVVAFNAGFLRATGSAEEPEEEEESD